MLHTEQNERINFSHKSGLILVFMAGVLWSTIGICIRLIQDATVWQILLYRSFSLSIFLLLLIIIRSNFKFKKIFNEINYTTIIGAISLVAAYSGGIYAIQKISVANAMFLFASAPFFAAGLGWLFLKETVTRATGVAIIVAMFGISVMVSENSDLGSIKGYIAAIISALGFALFTISLRAGKSRDMLPAVFLSGLFAIIICLVICWQQNLSYILQPRDTYIAFGMGVFQVGSGLFLYTLGSKSVPAAQLTLISMSEVLLGPFWVWLFLNEEASLQTLTGGILLLLAIAGDIFYSLKK